MNMYTYITEDNIKNPQYYMYTKYHGKDFLIEYFKIRGKRIRNIRSLGSERIEAELMSYLLERLKDNVRSTYLLGEAVLSGLDPDMLAWFSYWENVDIKDTKDITMGLALFPMAIRSEKLDKKSREFINIFIKKFEVFKKLRAIYGSEFRHREGYDVLSDIESYIYLCLAALKYYEKDPSLRFLNAALKLNDLVCSREMTLRGTSLEIAAEYCLLMEMRFVRKIMSDKGIEL